MSRSKTKPQANGPTQRQRRVGEEVRALLSSALLRGDIHVPDFDGTRITITEVRMSIDLHHAFAFVMPLGGDDMPGTLLKLKEISPMLRTHLAKALRLRIAPVLHFEPDLT